MYLTQSSTQKDAYLNHYLTHGIYERRDSGTEFNPLDYADRYEDLKEAFGDDVLALYHHYQTYGKTENREAKSEEVVMAERRAAEERRAHTETSTEITTETSYGDGFYYVTEYKGGKRIRQTRYENNGKYFIVDFNTEDEPTEGRWYREDDTLESIVIYYSDGKIDVQIFYNEISIHIVLMTQFAFHPWKLHRRVNSKRIHSKISSFKPPLERIRGGFL